MRAIGHVRSSLVKPRRTSGVGGGHLLDQGIGRAVVFALPVGEGFFCVRFKPLLFIKEDGRRTHEGEIARADGVAHQAMIFPLGVVAAVMLFDFDGPVFAHQFQEPLRAGFVRPATGDAVNGLLRGFNDPAFAQVLNFALQAEDLGGASQAEGGSCLLYTSPRCRSAGHGPSWGRS